MLLEQLTAASRAKQIMVDPFCYVATWNTLGVSATTTTNVSINADSDFVIRYGTITSYSAAGTNIALPDYLAEIFDTGSGRNFQDAAVHVGNYFGTAQRPFGWSEPKLIKGGSVLAIRLQNLTATAARVDIALHGLKVFYRGIDRSDLGLW